MKFPDYKKILSWPTSIPSWFKSEWANSIDLIKTNRNETFFISALAVLGFIFVIWGDFYHSKNLYAYSTLMCLAFLQNISFTFVSRSRQKDNFNYHLVAAIGSNGVWFLTYSQMIKHGMPISMLPVFLSGTALGSLFAAYESGKIEKLLGATADATKKKIKKKLTKKDAEYY